MNPMTYLRRRQEANTTRAGRGGSIRYGFGGGDDPKLAASSFAALPMSARAHCAVFDLRRVL
jgi:hypothetical protein